MGAQQVVQQPGGQDRIPDAGGGDEEDAHGRAPHSMFPVAATLSPRQLCPMPIAYLPDRGVVEISGEDRVAYLQGLISNDVAALAPG
ncbi:folate-binding protein, partial [Roseomonas mucosa]|nr:folate-binding protein [Roseomonas mucosa]